MTRRSRWVNDVVGARREGASWTRPVVVLVLLVAATGGACSGGPRCRLSTAGITVPPATTFDEYATSSGFSPLGFVGRVVVVRVHQDTKAEAIEASTSFDDATIRRIVEVEVVDALDRSTVDTRLQIHESSVSFNPTDGKEHDRGGPACYRFEVGSEAIVALGTPKQDGTRELRGGDASFFVIEDGRLSPELAEARAGTELADYPIVRAASRLTVDEFWARIEQTAARR